MTDTALNETNKVHSCHLLLQWRYVSVFNWNSLLLCLNRIIPSVKTIYIYITLLASCNFQLSTCFPVFWTYFGCSHVNLHASRMNSFVTISMSVTSSLIHWMNHSLDHFMHHSTSAVFQELKFLSLISLP